MTAHQTNAAAVAALGPRTRHRGAPAPSLPTPRGPLSDTIIGALRRAPGAAMLVGDVEHRDLLADDDAQLALTCCYELAYSGFRDVDDGWEHDPELVRVRSALERAFVRSIRDEIGPPPHLGPAAVVDELRGLAGAGGRSLSGWMAEHGTVEHFREFCMHRSQYQLKEADPHTWAIPRLRGRAKAAFVHIQYDEYGSGVPDAMHAELFATTMTALGLDPRYGAYRDLLPGPTLATGNLVTMLGLHRRWRAACAGHLALFEMTSVTPMSRYSATLRRLGLGAGARRFYDVHVAADAWHEQLALRELVGGLLEPEPDAGGLVLFGARALMAVEQRMAGSMIDAWTDDTTALLAPLPASLAA